MRNRFFFALVFTLALVGCATGGGQGSRLLPWNWFHPDANARVQKADAKLEARQNDAVHAAHREMAKAELVLRGAPVSRERDLAVRFLGNGLGLMDQVRPLTAEESAADRQIVADFLSGVAERVTAAERAQAKAEGTAAEMSRELAAAQTLVREANAKLAKANQENAEQAATFRKWRFYIFGAIGIWLVLQLLAGAARFYPGLAPVAALAGRLSSPVVHAAYERATGAMGRVLRTVENVNQGAAQLVREHLDAETDAAEQLTVRKHYEAAKL